MLAKSAGSVQNVRLASADQAKDNPAKNTAGQGAVGAISKSETVYCKLDPQGNVKDTTVVTWFHFADGVPETVSDPVDLDNPRALNGSFKVKKNDRGIVLSDLSSEQKDIFYSGQTKKALPVTCHIKYYLDGREIAGSQLPGKSGEVKITFRIENQLKSQENITCESQGQKQQRCKEVYTPLMTMVSLELPIEHFSDVDAPDGIVTAVGETIKVNWVLFPYPDAEATLNMRAEDFTLDAVNMVVQPQMPPLPSLDMGGKLDELNDGLTRMDEALQKIEEGSQVLAAGQAKLVAGVNQVKEGTGKLLLLNQAEAGLIKGALQINDKLVESLNPYASQPVAADIVRPVLAGLQKQKLVLSALLEGGELDGQKVPTMSTAMSSLELTQGALGKLSEGAESSRQGAEKIARSIAQVREEGIAPIKEGLNQSLVDLKIGEGQKAIMESKVKNYTTFLGKDPNVSGKVQFIIQTEELK